MSNYTKSTNFATKDNLTPGDPLKVVRGTEIDTEFNNIATAVATKTDNSAAAITGGSITGITDLAIADGGTGASTATAAINNLLPSQTSNANKYLQTDGTNVSWDAVSLSTSDITGTLPVANGGTGVTSSTGTGSVVLSNSPTLVTPALGTPASGVATNLTGLPISTGVSGLGTGVATFLGTPSSANLASAVTDETGSGALVFANSPTLVTPALGTPSSATLTNATGLPISTGVSGLGTGVATFLATPSSANLASAVSDETGSGALVFANSPTLVTPALGTPSSGTLTNATGLPISTGVSGLGTGVATALAVNVGSAGAPVVNGGALGTPSSGTVTNLTGTASININGTVGATTPTTGAFTTLAASSSVTLSGGTANGVTYLNGSKVLTSGSALTFDGTNLLVGTASSIFTTTVLQATSATTQVAGFQQTGGASNSAIATWNTGTTGPIYQHKFAYGAAGSLAGSITTDSSGNTSYNSAGAVVFGYSGTTEGMRLTSTGLGIGTSSPTTKTQITKAALTGFVSRTAATLTLENSGDTELYFASGNANVGQLRFGDDGGNFRGAISYDHSSDGFLFYTTGSEKMRLDSAGNLGLGTTSPYSGGISLGTSDAAAFISPGGTNNNMSIATTGPSGTIRFFVNGTTGARGTTQAMTLDASGYLNVGTTLGSANAFRLGVLNNIGLIPTTQNTVGSIVSLQSALGNASSESFITNEITGYVNGGNYATALRFYTRSTTAAVERARIDSSGNLLVGRTSRLANELVSLQCAGTAGANTNGILLNYTGTPNDTTHDFLQCVDGNWTTTRASIRSNGGIANYSANNVNLSDQRVKTDIQDAGNYLAKICAIPVRTFKYKDQSDDLLNLGVIAQEVEAVAPELVDVSGFGETPEDGVPLKAIYQTDLQYALMKAIQELKAEFDAYKASHP